MWPLDPKLIVTYWLGCLYGGPLYGFMLATLAYRGLAGTDQQGIGEILQGSLPEPYATPPLGVADRQRSAKKPREAQVVTLRPRPALDPKKKPILPREEQNEPSV